MAGQRTLDPLMVVRIHQGQLAVVRSPVCLSKAHRQNELATMTTWHKISTSRQAAVYIQGGGRGTAPIKELNSLAPEFP